MAYEDSGTEIVLNRRTCGAVLGMMATVGISGCGELGIDSREDNESRGTNSEAATRTPPEKPVQGQGQSLSIDQSVTDEPGYDDDFEYFPSNGTVRAVFLRTDDSVQTEDVSFEEWAKTKSAEIAEERVKTAMKERLDQVNTSTRLVKASNSPYSSDIIGLRIHGTLQEYWEAVNVAPPSAEVTITLEDNEFSQTLDVMLTGYSEDVE